jgi:PhzF family phenazine biosynthesis protein
MNIQRLAAFSVGDAGGNPAGVVIGDALPSVARMQTIAAEVGYSETAFAAPQADGWAVRYFAPTIEVPFCGHATIALGAALGAVHGAGRYVLHLANGAISTTAGQQGGHWHATLQSPPTRSGPLPDDLTARLLTLFGWTAGDLDPRLPPLLAHGGVDHAVLTLGSRERLASMAYPFDALRDLMAEQGLTTVSLIHIADALQFDARNAFAIGGVVEDPATGAAAAALGGALVDLGWPALTGGGMFHIRQGTDMGMPSDLNVTVTGRPGDSVAVGGTVRWLDPV